MKWFQNMNIGTKITLVFVLVTIICASTGVYSIVTLNALKVSDTELYENTCVPLNTMAKISESFQRQRVNIREAIIRDDPEIIAKELEKIQQRRDEIDQLSIEFEKTITSDEMQTVFDEFLTAKNEFRPLLELTISFIESGNKEAAAALIAADGAAGKSEFAEIEAIDNVLTQKVENGETKAITNSTQASSNIWTTKIIILVVLILSIVVGILFARSISKPINATGLCAKALAKGQLDAPLKIKSSKDETGQLASIIDNEVRSAFKEIEKARVKSAKQSAYQLEHEDKLVINLERLAKGELYCDMTVSEADQDTQDLFDLFTKISNSLHDSINTINDYISEISDVLGEMANENMDVEITREYRGKFKNLKQSINEISNSFNNVLTDIKTSADQVSAGTDQIAVGSEQIAQGATEQSSSLQDLSATITQIAAQSKENAQNATKANDLSIIASNNAKSGNEQMKEMQQAMLEIDECSQNVSKIIKVIDDIAFQTNILALNAAVEAARAGQHGKGFAVVADEVRNLAEKSSTAAKETAKLIDGSLKKVKAGSQIGNEMSAELKNILNDIEKALEFVGQIAEASNEQASAIVQVNNGIDQLSMVVQANSATSEESAAASEELSSQANLLKENVSRFTLKTNHDDNYMDMGLNTSGKIIQLNSTQETTQSNEDTPENNFELDDKDFGKY